MRDWQVGDLAVCVAASDACEPILQEGRAYEIIGFEVPGEISPQNGYLNNERGGLALILAGVKSHGVKPSGRPWAGWKEARFRKIRPDQHEPCEAEFVTLLNRTKLPVRASVTTDGEV